MLHKEVSYDSEVTLHTIERPGRSSMTLLRNSIQGRIKVRREGSNGISPFLNGGLRHVFLDIANISDFMPIIGGDGWTPDAGRTTKQHPP
jgi:hypothetical protein